MYVVMAVVSPLLEARDVNAVSASWNFGSSEVTRRWGDISDQASQQLWLTETRPQCYEECPYNCCKTALLAPFPRYRQTRQIVDEMQWLQIIWKSQQYTGK